MQYNELLQELDIVEVIKEYIPLKEKGESYSACCPFHHEETPSFSVSPGLQIFKCFSSECSQAGNAITFVSKFENISAHQAFINLCRKYGREDLIDVDSKKLIRLYKSNKQVCQTYHYNIRDPRKYPEAVEYLKGRGLDFETVEAFKLGYAPKDRYFLQRQGFSEEILQELKLLKSSKSTHKKEHFYNRVIIPFYHNGNIVGFSGRTLADVNPKYLNTKESDIFKKREILFGWYQNYKTIRSRKEAILVEGQFDVITMYAKGIRYVVGFAGGFMSDKAVNFLSKNVNNIIFFADGDKAGRKSALRMSKAFVNLGVKVTILYKEDEDPSSVLNKQSWMQVKSQYSYRPWEFIYQYLGIEECMEYISHITDPFKQSALLKKLSAATGKEEFQLEKLITVNTNKQVTGLKIIEENEPLSPLDKAIFISSHRHLPLEPEEKKLLLNHIRSSQCKSREEYVDLLKADSSKSGELFEVFQRAKQPEYVNKVLAYVKAETIKVEISNLKEEYRSNQDSAILKQIQELNMKLNESKNR